MNINVPIIECFVRLEFMNQEREEFAGQYAPCQIFGMASIPGQTPLFHFFCDDGGIYWRMPIHAFCHVKDAVRRNLDELVLWDSFSYHASVTTFDILKNKRMSYIDRRRKQNAGTYVFTVDWFGDDDKSYGFAEIPGQHKCAHLIRLDDGNFALQPNNRLKLFDPNFVVRDEPYPRMLACALWSSERTSKWRTSDDEQYDYGLEQCTTENS